MPTNKPLVVYGASGFTGQLVAEELSRRKLPFLVAGRNQEKLESLRDRLKANGNDIEARAVAHTVCDMAELFKGARVVINISGPYNQIGYDVVTAAVQAGCHYVDVTGEQDFMITIKHRFDAAARSAGLAILPSTAFHWAPGGCAAKLVLDIGGIEKLRITYQVGGYMTIASAKSTFRVSKRKHYRIMNGKRAEYDYKSMFQPSELPGQGRVPATCLGTAEIVWFEDDDRVKEMDVLRADPASKIVSRGVMFFHYLQKWISLQRLDRFTDTMTDMFWRQKKREVDGESAFLIHAVGTGPCLEAVCNVRGDRPYLMTSILVGEATERLLAGTHRETGFCAPHDCFGARELLDATQIIGVTVEESNRCSNG